MPQVLTMNLTQLQSYLLSKTGATEETPFGPENLVYKVMGRMFALVPLDADPLTISLKCEPGQALLLRCLLYTSPSPRDRTRSRMPSSA